MRINVKFFGVVAVRDNRGNEIGRTHYNIVVPVSRLENVLYQHMGSCYKYSVRNSEQSVVVKSVYDVLAMVSRSAANEVVLVFAWAKR